jgi:hypothetical protein
MLIVDTGAEGRWRGRRPGSNVSMITMRDPQCGQGWSSFSEGVVSWPSSVIMWRFARWSDLGCRGDELASAGELLGASGAAIGEQAVVPDATFVTMQHRATLLYAMSVSNSWTGSQSRHDTVVRITASGDLCRFEPGWIYRMPTHYGPAPGPRLIHAQLTCRRVLAAILPCQLVTSATAKRPISQAAASERSSGSEISHLTPFGEKRRSTVAPNSNARSSRIRVAP